MARGVTYKQLMSYHVLGAVYEFINFSSEAEALEYIRARRWRKYTLSSNAAGDCWTVYHKER